MFFYSEGGETLDQAAQRGSGGPFKVGLDRTLSSLIWLKMSLLIAGGLD